MPYAQAKIRRDTNRVALISYTTTVCEIVGGVLIVHGLYSMTTRKHISAFMREYAHPCDYQTAKAIYNDNKMINVHTGEVEDLD
jgi:hypothetical protein